MKKIFISIFTLTLLCILSACTSPTEKEQSSTDSNKEEVEKSNTTPEKSTSEENNSISKEDDNKSEEIESLKKELSKLKEGNDSEEVAALKKELDELKEDKNREEIKQLKKEIDELKENQKEATSHSHKVTKEPRLIENERGGTDYSWPHDLTDISHLTFGKNMDEEMAIDACSLVQYYNDSLVRLYNGDITAITFFVGNNLYENTLLPNYYSGDFRNQTASVECLKADYYPDIEQIYVIADRTFSHVSGSGIATMEYIIDANTMEVIDFNEIEVR